MKSNRLALVVAISGLLVGSAFGAAPLFQDDFSNGLGKWYPGAWNGYGEIRADDGVAAPSAYAAGLYSYQTFDIVGKPIEFSADMKGEIAEMSLRTSDLDVIATFVITGPSHPFPNAVGYQIWYAGINGREAEDAYMPLGINPNEWQRYRVSINPSGILQVFVGDSSTPALTSTHSVAYLPNQPHLCIGNWGELYDNVLVTPEPSCMALLTIGGVLLLGRRRH